MKKLALLVLSFIVLAAGSVMAADPAKIDWSKVTASTVTLFYPGQSSYEWCAAALIREAPW